MIKDQAVLVTKHAEDKAALNKEHPKELTAMKDHHVAENLTQHNKAMEDSIEYIHRQTTAKEKLQEKYS